MNKNMKYWAAGIIAAVVIIVIAAVAAAGSRRKNPEISSARETESGSPASDASLEAEGGLSGTEEGAMNHSGHGSGKGSAGTSDGASGDDNINRYLHKQDEIMMDMMHAMENIPKTGNASIDFLNGMIPHHESAVEMAESYLEYGGSDETLKTLAENIKTTQTEEIRQMKELIEKYQSEGHTDNDQESAYLDEYDKMLDHDHEMSKSGADSLEHAFAEGMIMHHQMAVDMAKSILEYTNYEEIRTLAQNIIDAQEKEIEEMRQFIH